MKFKPYASLFLDEPAVALAPLARSAVWEHILPLCEEFGSTIFRTTHSMQEVGQLCQWAAIMHLGRMEVIL